jgi:hypothetical protein
MKLGQHLQMDFELLVACAVGPLAAAQKPVSVGKFEAAIKLAIV